MDYPPWLVLHVPHDSTEVPGSVREQFLLSDDQLTAELKLMTDHWTLALFERPGSRSCVVRASVSRLVVDVERFASDDHEIMASRGMGCIYTVTSQLTPLRRPLSAEERRALLREYYVPHHQRLESAVSSALERNGRCLIIDCHSFPSRPLPYELARSDSPRPDICIGTDDFHTSTDLADAFVKAFRGVGWNVSVNEPFAGAMVPNSQYHHNPRVQAVMVEVNRRLYLREPDAGRLPDFAHVADRIRQCCMLAIGSAGDAREQVPAR
jgi:N-formylglutamate deformylase